MVLGISTLNSGELYPEYYVMVTFMVTGIVLLALGAIFSLRRLSVVGSVFALIYIVTFFSLVKAPAHITPLFPLACGLILVVWIAALLPDSDVRYNILK